MFIHASSWVPNPKFRLSLSPAVAGHTHTHIFQDLCSSREGIAQTLKNLQCASESTNRSSHVSQRYPWLSITLYQKGQKGQKGRKPPMFPNSCCTPWCILVSEPVHSSKTHMAYSLSATKFSCTDRSPICGAVASDETELFHG